jgi:hypothetical protein
MKVVVSKDLFYIPSNWVKLLNASSRFAPEVDRTNPKLIELVESNPFEAPDLVVVHIPDNVTDYLIIEEGDDADVETLLFVIDGKIYSITPAYDDEARYFGKEN